MRETNESRGVLNTTAISIACRSGAVAVGSSRVAIALRGRAGDSRPSAGGSIRKAGGSGASGNGQSGGASIQLDLEWHRGSANVLFLCIEISEQ